MKIRYRVFAWLVGVCAGLTGRFLCLDSALSRTDSDHVFFMHVFLNFE